MLPITGKVGILDPSFCLQWATNKVIKESSLAVTHIENEEEEEEE